MSSIFFSTSSKTVSLRCSFCFHVDSNRATAHASNERRLSASRDIRSIRIAITVPCQYHQHRSLGSLFRANVELSGYDAIIYILRCQRQYALLGFVIRNTYSRTCKTFLVTISLLFFAVPAPALLFGATSLCAISVFIPIKNPHLTIVHFGKTLRVYTQPAVYLGSMVKHPMRV